MPDFPDASNGLTTPSPAEITTKETASTPSPTDQPKTRRPTAREEALHSLHQDLDGSGSADDPFIAPENVTSKKMLPMLVRTDNGYIYLVSSSSALSSSAVMLIAFLTLSTLKFCNFYCLISKFYF